MPKAKAVEPNTLIKAWVSPELKGKLYIHLTSELEGRIPLGKISAFVSERIREFFGWKTLDLAAFGFPAGFFVKGPEAMIEALRKNFTEKQVVSGWWCGCGHVNGINLAVCSACGRKPNGEHP